MLNRRSLITGLISFVAAPAIVRAESLMPVRAVPAWLAHGEFPVPTSAMRRFSVRIVLEEFTINGTELILYERATETDVFYARRVQRLSGETPSSLRRPFK